MQYSQDQFWSLLYHFVWEETAINPIGLIMLQVFIAMKISKLCIVI